MATNDPISDLLTRIRNATRAQHRFVDLLSSRMNQNLVRILKEQGFIENYLVKEDNKQGQIRVFLKYMQGRKSIINNLKRMSKPGLRCYVRYEAIPIVRGGLGISIVSTSQGVMVGREAYKKKIGGELLCCVW